jgi:hypothetical protein
MFMLGSKLAKMIDPMPCRKKNRRVLIQPTLYLVFS